MRKREKISLSFFMFFLFLITLIFVVNYFTGIFDPLLFKVAKKSYELIPEAEKFLLKQAFAGISIGTFILTFILLIYPVFVNELDIKEYYRDFFYGLLTTLVFYLTEKFKLILINLKIVDFLLIIIGIIIFTYLLIEIVSKMFRDKQKSVAFKS